MSNYISGIDVGGTFTDFVSFDPETKEMKVWKNLTTPGHPINGVLTGLSEFENVEDIDQIRHGTTIATNAILERKGAEIAYITTKGFKDVPFIQRANRKSHYDLSWIKPKPLVKRRNCFEINERLTHKGETLAEIDVEEVKQVAEQIKERGNIDAVAISTLYSYVDPKHEEKLRSLLEEFLPGMPISISYDVLPKWKEYERGSTVIADAYIKPIVSSYLDQLSERFQEKDITKNVGIMKSNGGIMTLAATKKAPINTAVSGPTGGVVGAKRIVEQCNIDHLVTLDMGGTSTDVAIIKNGNEELTTNFEIEWGIPIQVPMIDIRTIGAGGGSIAWIDNGGMLNVGPESAGADPGPVCYERGGENPTVTDANLILGRLSPDNFLGGSMKIDYDAAYQALDRLGKKLNMSAEETADSIIKIANNSMVGALRMVLVEEGHDPRDFTLMNFGGAGPLHASDLMEIAEIPRAVIPMHPGQFSAVGFMYSDARVDLQRTVQMTSKKFDISRANEVFQQLKNAGLEDLSSQGYTDNYNIITSIEMRYLGQNYELDIPFNEEEINEENVQTIWNTFHSMHDDRFGFKIDGEVMEVVTFKVTIISKTDKPAAKKIARANGSQAVQKDERMVRFDQESLMTTIYDRETLLDGHEIVGPAIIEENASSTIVGPQHKLTVDSFGNMHIEKR
ncbi:MAG TPA: hydantoinase/oxoprolinase family protein [Bacillus bacterium]|uniref:hydantoinase/oxoprolinase family protein n=1 Tax=Siminovitchia fordii TaxID=254759 RepID=UPI00036435E9|nr:hydantoinase/oxoprolinase family protein [Siminovitchia fordii]HBZ09986.1 hydantoinase/oxoprolinase family protein [Bacillus sp. (in: firmicutes)]